MGRNCQFIKISEGLATHLLKKWILSV